MHDNTTSRDLPCGSVVVPLTLAMAERLALDAEATGTTPEQLAADMLAEQLELVERGE